MPLRELVDNHETRFESSARQELSTILEQALQQLLPRYREVFWLRDVEQVSGTETAAILGITVACVKTRLLRARLQLRSYLAPILGIETPDKPFEADSMMPCVASRNKFCYPK